MSWTTRPTTNVFMLHFKLQKAKIWFLNVLCHVSVFILLMYKQKINRERNCRRSEIYWCYCRSGTRLDLYGFRSTPRPPRRGRGVAGVVNSFTIIFYFNIILQWVCGGERWRLRRRQGVEGWGVAEVERLVWGRGDRERTKSQRKDRERERERKLGLQWVKCELIELS